MPIVFKPDFRPPKRRGKPPERPAAPTPPVYAAPPGAPPSPVPPSSRVFGCGCGAGWLYGAYSTEAVCWTLGLLLERLGYPQGGGEYNVPGFVTVCYGLLHLGMMGGWLIGGMMGLQLLTRKPEQGCLVSTLTGIGMVAGGLVGYFVGEALGRAAGGGRSASSWCAIDGGSFAGLYPVVYSVWYGFLGGGLLAGAGLVAAALRRTP